MLSDKAILHYQKWQIAAKLDWKKWKKLFFPNLELHTTQLVGRELQWLKSWKQKMPHNLLAELQKADNLLYRKFSKMTRF